MTVEVILVWKQFKSEVRDRELGDEVEYYVGQVFRHKKYDYYGVIVGWDRECIAPERWKKDNLGS